MHWSKINSNWGIDRNILPMEKEQIYTEEIQDIIGKPPHGLVRWGITWVFLLIIAIIGLSAFIYYPDIVKAPMRIHTTHSPKVLVSKLSGHIVRLPMEENTWVRSGQVIAWMESTGDHMQVQRLSEGLIAFREQAQRGIRTPPCSPILSQTPLC